MGTLYVDRRDITLGLEPGRLVLREAGSKGRAVPLNLIDRVVVRGAATLDTALLGALAERGIGLACLSARYSRRTALLLGPGHADARRRLGQYRLCSDPALCLAVARGLVDGKLAAQRRLLATALDARPDARKPLGDGLARLDALVARIAAADSLNALRGLEGAAAAAHFGALVVLFAPALGFSGRRRRPPPDPVNASLSLGYTLLHLDAVRAAHGAGLDPLLGCLHDPAYGRESLACDLIEPLRPHLDGWVWGLFRDRVLRPEHFSASGDAVLLGKAGRQAFYGCFEVWARAPRRWLRRQCYALARQCVALAPALATVEAEP